MGIATRMRGLGNVGLHKYANCTTRDDLQKMNINWKNDLLLGEWNYVLPKLKAANSGAIFNKTAALKKFNVDLPVCVNANSMFESSTNMYEFNGDISVVPSCRNTFYGTRLRKTEFDFSSATDCYTCFQNINTIKTSAANFPKMTNGGSLFSICYRLTTFSGKIPKMTYGDSMFNQNYNFSNFEADLPVLSDGNNIFGSCILNKESVIRIANTLPTYTSGTHKITIGIQKSLETDEEVLAAIATIKSKGWTVTTQWNTGYNGLEVLSNELNEKMELGIELPEGYTRLYYLEDLGRQWIDTEYIPTVNTGLYVIGKQIVSVEGWPIGISNATDGRSQGLTAPFWSRTSTYTACFQFNGLIAFNNYGRGEAYEGWTNFLNDKVSKVDARGAVYSKNLSTHTRTWNYPMHMFRINAYNSTNKKAFNGRIYRVKISEGTEIVRDYVPALDPNGRPCMFELYEQKPYYNENPEEEFWYDFPPTNSN